MLKLAHEQRRPLNPEPPRLRYQNRTQRYEFVSIAVEGPEREIEVDGLRQFCVVWVALESGIMADMIGRAVWRASRTPLGFVVAPSLSSHWNQTRTVGRCVTMCGKFSTSGLRSLERVSARQVQVLASESSSHAVVADDEGVDGVEGGVSPLSELCAGKVPEYLLRR